MKKEKKQLPVYDICSLAGGLQDQVIAERFAAYLLVHPNLHKAHRHTFYHIVLFTKGSGTHTIDFEQFLVVPGQVYCMIPGQVHSWAFEGEVDGYIINFSIELLQSFIKDSLYPEQFSFFNGIAAESVLQLPEKGLARVIPLFEQVMAEVREQDAHSSDMLSALLASLFITISRTAPVMQHRQAPPHNQFILNNFRKLVDEYYTEKRLPKEYAAMLYITPNHLNALCKDLLGKPAGELIRDRILLEAKRLLINLSVAISEVAYELGFTDNSYFTRFFRKNTGITPEEFRASFTENTMDHE